MKKILFLCTHNSARSQMAEAWCKHIHPNTYKAFSAGTEVTSVNPFAKKAMYNQGIDLTSHYSKTVEELGDEQFHFVITVCSKANQHCPVFKGNTKIIHYGFEDPVTATNDLESDEEKLEVFERVALEVRDFVKEIEKHLK